MCEASEDIFSVPIPIYLTNSILQDLVGNEACPLYFSLFFFLSEYSCFTLLCQFLIHSSESAMHMHVSPFFVPSRLGHHRAASRAPCAPQQVLTGYLFYICVCAQLCLILFNPMQPTRLLCPLNFPDQNTGVDCCLPFQGIFVTQGSNPCLLHLLHWQADSLPLTTWGSPQQYLCQFQSPNSFPPHFPTWYPYVCSLPLCLYFCFANKIIFTIFLDSTFFQISRLIHQPCIEKWK